MECKQPTIRIREYNNNYEYTLIWFPDCILMKTTYTHNTIHIIDMKISKELFKYLYNIIGETDNINLYDELQYLDNTLIIHVVDRTWFEIKVQSISYSDNEYVDDNSVYKCILEPKSK